MKVIGYARVSTTGQADNGASLPVQLEKIRTYADFKDWELVAVETDGGQSAKELNRPALGRVLEMVEAGEVEAVIVYKLDRLTRSVADLDRLVALFDRRQVALVSLQENLDATTATGRLMMNLLASVSQWEREVIGERTAAALQHKKANGEAYGRTPFGYDRREDRLVESAEEQRALRRMKTWRAAGWSLRQIGRELEALNVPTKQGGRRWYAATVKAVLENDLHTDESQEEVA